VRHGPETPLVLVVEISTRRGEVAVISARKPVASPDDSANFIHHQQVALWEPKGQKQGISPDNLQTPRLNLKTTMISFRLMRMPLKMKLKWGHLFPLLFNVLFDVSHNSTNRNPLESLP